MDKDTFNTIRRALHPDSRNSISGKKLADAFRAFMALENKASPTKFTYPDGSEIPSNLAEWDKRRAAARKAKRTSGRFGSSPTLKADLLTRRFQPPPGALQPVARLAGQHVMLDLQFA